LNQFQREKPLHKFRTENQTQSECDQDEIKRLRRNMNEYTHLWRPPHPKHETGALITTWWQPVR